MRKKDTLRGIECIFKKRFDVWPFLSSLCNLLGSPVFNVVDASVFSHGQKLSIPPVLPSSFFESLTQVHAVGERLVLRLYLEKENLQEIDTYEDFQKSNCEMIILLYDFCYVEVYSKKQQWTQQFFDLAISTENTIVEKKYDSSDPRTTMYV